MDLRDFSAFLCTMCDIIPAHAAYKNSFLVYTLTRDHDLETWAFLVLTLLSKVPILLSGSHLSHLLE